MKNIGDSHAGPERRPNGHRSGSMYKYVNYLIKPQVYSRVKPYEVRSLIWPREQLRYKIPTGASPCLTDKKSYGCWWLDVTEALDKPPPPWMSGHWFFYVRALMSCYITWLWIVIAIENITGYKSVYCKKHVDCSIWRSIGEKKKSCTQIADGYITLVGRQNIRMILGGYYCRSYILRMIFFTKGSFPSYLYGRTFLWLCYYRCCYY